MSVKINLIRRDGRNVTVVETETGFGPMVQLAQAAQAAGRPDFLAPFEVEFLSGLRPLTGAIPISLEGWTVIILR